MQSRNQTQDTNRRQQRQRRDGQVPVMLCSLCFLLFKKSCSQSKIPRPGTARRNQNPVGRNFGAQRRRERGEKVLPKMQSSPILHCKEDFVVASLGHETVIVCHGAISFGFLCAFGS